MYTRLLDSFSMVWPFIAPILAGYLLWSGLREARIQWWRLLVSVLAIGLLCLSLFASASLGGLGGAVAFMIGLLSAFIALVVAIWLAGTLPRWRKLAGPIFWVALVAAMILSIAAGNWHAPEDPKETTQRNGDLIIQALDKYHAATGQYPEELTQLEPTHLETLPDALTTQGTGWLYESDGHDFTLGYWHSPDRYGTPACLYASQDRTWECDAFDWGPFEPLQTPPGSCGKYMVEPPECLRTPQAPD